MGKRISVDNNFFNAYFTKDDNVQAEFIRAFQTKKFSFYLTSELIAELFSLFSSVNKELLPKYSKLLLELGDFRIFKQWQDIVLQELRIVNSDSIYCSNSEVENIVKILRHFSLGEPVENEVALKELIAAVKKHKKQWFLRNKEEKSLLEQSLRGSNVNKITFKEFYNTNGAIDIRKKVINTILASEGKTFPATKIDEIAINQEKYPYFHMGSKIKSALFYFHNLQNGAVEWGDEWDTSYFVYLVDLDYLITEERRLKYIGEIIFGDSKRIINFNEASDLVNKLKMEICSQKDKSAFATADIKFHK